MAREPVFNAPAVVVGLLGLLVAVFAVTSLLPEMDQAWWDLALAFIPSRFSGNAVLLPGGVWAMAWTWITHQVVHGDLTHIIINCAWLLIFGSVIAARVGATRFLALTVTSGIAGAALFLLVRFGENAPMVGASGAVSGLMGAAFRVLFSAIDMGGLELLRIAPRDVPRMSIREALADRRVQSSLAVWLGMNALMAVAAPAFTSQGGIAWEAHVGGFIYGFLVFGLFDRGTGAVIQHRPTPVRTLH